MVYSSQNAAFRRDKNQFFTAMSALKDDSSKIKAIEERVQNQNMGYAFLLENKNALESEFTHMFNILKKQDGDNKEIFWFYCYYCASLSEAFYRSYGQKNKEEEYKKTKQDILDLMYRRKKNNDPVENFIDFLENAFLNSFNNIINAPFHTSQIRDYVAYSNLCRIYGVFLRLTLTTGLKAAKDLHLIEKLDALLGTHTDVDKIISTLQAPVNVFNYFSVGFFLARFMIDAGGLLRHTFFPTDEEKGAEHSSEIHKMKYLPGPANLESYRNSYIFVEDEHGDIELYYIPKQGKQEKLIIKDKNKLKEELLKKLNQEQSIRLTAQDVKNIITAQTHHIPEATTAFDRFKYELSKRHCNFANDLVWATVNLLTNFNTVIGIPGPVAGYITSVFLVFDVCMQFYKCNLAKKEYLTKKAQYLEEIEDYNNPEKYKMLTADQKLVHVGMLNKQLIELEIKWHAKEANFYFLAAAASLLMIGFTASMLVSPPLLVAGCFFVCTLAVAMYLSSDSYSLYKEKSLYLEQAELTGNNLPMALKEYEIARNDFIFTMAKNTIMPILIIGTFAVCWPAAVALTAIYIGYELYHAYSQRVEKKAVEQLALTGPVEEHDEGDDAEEDGCFLSC